ncbi:unnamed protein product, partial [Ixodes hexagonus]
MSSRCSSAIELTRWLIRSPWSISIVKMATLTYASLLLRPSTERVFRDHRDAFDMSDARFVREYLLTKGVTRWLCDELRGRLQRRREGPHVLTVEQQVLAALRLYAAGGFQATVGSDENISVHQCTISRVLVDVTDAIVDCLGASWLIFPQTQEEKAATKK